MLTLAVTFTAGALATRFWPQTIQWVGWVWAAAGVAFLTLSARPPKNEAFPASLPEEYRRHIFPARGLLARRGIGRFMLALALSALALGMHRQNAWEVELTAARDMAARSGVFSASLLALEPGRSFQGAESGWRIGALLLTANGEEVSVPVRLFGKGPAFRRGDVLNARVRFRENYPRTFPGAFNVRLWLERDGHAASLDVLAPRGKNMEKPPYEIVRMEHVSLLTTIRRGIDQVRGMAIEATLRHENETIGGMLAAMLYGYRESLDGESRDIFRRVGIGHVLAISGLHVGLIVGLLWWVLGRFSLHYRVRALACLVLALVYLGLSGGQVAAMRATVMAVIHLAGLAWGRRSDMLNSLGLAALFLTILNPSAPADVSFQLSFTAVVFIYLSMARVRDVSVPEAPVRGTAGKWSRVTRRLRGEVVSLFLISFATWFGLFPIIMMVFHQVNLVGLVINIVVIPLMSVVLACGLLLPCLAWAPGCAFLLSLPGELLVWIAVKADGLPYSSFPAHAPDGEWLAAFYLFFSLLLLGRAIKKRAWRRGWAAVCWLAIAVATGGVVLSAASEPPPAEGRLSLLPTGGMDVLIAEGTNGAIAILGKLSREGLREANWLHHLKRTGKTTLFALDAASVQPDLPALEYHSGVAGRLVVSAEPADGALAARSRRWVPLPGIDGVDISVSRNWAGRIIWLAARCPGGMATVTVNLTERQLGARLEEGIPGSEANFLSTLIRRNAVLPDTSGPVAGRVRALKRAGTRELPPGWIDRDAYGAVVIGDGVVNGFDGADWRLLE